jgi:hypothetical protein
MRLFSTVLAVWFIGLTASVHLLHTHPELPYCHALTPIGNGTALLETTSHSEATHASGFAGLCPVCLFLAGYLCDGPSQAPEVALDDCSLARARPAAPARLASPGWPAATPRAPPA